MSPEGEAQAGLEQLSKQVLDSVEEKFNGHPKLEQVKEIISRFSPRGGIVIASYLLYSLEDNVFDEAWEILHRAWEEHYSSQHPGVRGDPDLIDSNKLKLLNMSREAGIRWPRLEEGDPSTEEVKVITLGKDPKLRGKLERKLAEYNTRLESSNPEHVKDAHLKIIVLSLVLEKGSVSVEEIKESVSKEFDSVDNERFDDAVWIINEYCTKGGRGRVKGGTGLK